MGVHASSAVVLGRIVTDLATNSEIWIRRFHPASGAVTRLVVLPHARGSASFYFPLSRALAPRFDVLAVQVPGSS